MASSSAVVIPGSTRLFISASAAATTLPARFMPSRSWSVLMVMAAPVASIVRVYSKANHMRRPPALIGILLALGMVLLPLALRLPAVAASPLQAPGRLAEVRYIYHGLGVQPPAHPTHSARVHDPLLGGYGLQTRVGQRASMAFGDGTTLHVNQNTSLILSSPHMTVVRSGEVAEYLRPGTDHRVQTAAAVAS